MANIDKGVFYALGIFLCACSPPNKEAKMKIHEVKLSNLYHEEPYYHLYMVEYNGTFDSTVIKYIDKYVAENYAINQNTSTKYEHVNFMTYNKVIFNALNEDKLKKQRMEWYYPKYLLLSYTWKNGIYVNSVQYRKNGKYESIIRAKSPFDKDGN